MRIYRILISVFYFLWTAQVSSTNVVEDVQKIENLATALKNLAPMEFGGQKAAQMIRDHHLDLTTCSERVRPLYTEVRWVNGGGRATVFKATLAHDRPQAGLKAGDIIALRVVDSIPKPLIKSAMYPTGYEPLIRLSTFKKLEPNAQQVTAYFPDFYGVYFSGPIPRSIVIDKYPEHMIDAARISNHRYEEMEWVDTTFSQFIHEEGKKLADSMIFEFLYGEWAGEAMIGLSVNDCKFRNYGLKSVSSSRCYHIGESVYYWADHMMPVRLDLEGAYSVELPRKTKFYNRTLDPKYAAAETGKQFLIAWHNRNQDLFTLLTCYFSAYQKTSKWVQDNDPHAKHFFLEQKWVDLEKSL